MRAPYKELILLVCLTGCLGNEPSLLPSTPTTNLKSARIDAEEEVKGIQVCTVPEWAYDNDKLSLNSPNWNKEGTAESGIVSHLLDELYNDKWDGLCIDWDTALQASKTLTGDRESFREGIDVFLVFRIDPSPNPSGGVCQVTIEVHCGRPYNKNSAPKYIFSGLAAMGEPSLITAGPDPTITTQGECIYHAARAAAQTLVHTGILNYKLCPKN